jgi:hypothetical protein
MVSYKHLNSTYFNWILIEYSRVPDFEFVHPKLDDDDEPVVIDGLALLSNNCIGNCFLPLTIPLPLLP